MASTGSVASSGTSVSTCSTGSDGTSDNASGGTPPPIDAAVLARVAVLAAVLVTVVAAEADAPAVDSDAVLTAVVPTAAEKVEEA